MSTTNNMSQNNWWAEGDTPVHANLRVTYLVDGRTTLFTMCRHFLMAHRYIYLANWGITPKWSLYGAKINVQGQMEVLNRMH